MFFTFLQKQDPGHLDISALLNYTPRAIFYYYYNSPVIVSAKTYEMLSETADSKQESAISAQIWLDFFHKELSAFEDLSSFLKSEYLEIIGPYYYPAANSRIYFSHKPVREHENLEASDLHILTCLDNSVPVIKSLMEFNRTRKPSKKNIQSKEDLFKELDMCLLALQEIEKINRHMNYLRQLLNIRYALVEKEDLRPPEPDIIPVKPIKTPDSDPSFSSIISLALNRKRKKDFQNDASRHNFAMKTYIIRYREYEKACERYKGVLENWHEYQQEFISRCFQDIEHMEDKLKIADRYIQLCNNILLKSKLHLKYLNTAPLNTFKQYLETGRTNNIQECMNLYEDELHWNEIKASQERIENTIYFLQSANEYALLADEEIGQILKNKNNSVLVEA